jgi:hypothetical protein
MGPEASRKVLLRRGGVASIGLGSPCFPSANRPSLLITSGRHELAITESRIRFLEVWIEEILTNQFVPGYIIRVIPIPKLADS